MITDDEMAVLLIAASGEFMLAIGRWEAPIKSLAEKGMLKTEWINGGPQFTITAAGKQAIAEREQDEDRQLAEVINKGSTVLGRIRGYAEQAAQLLVKAAQESTQVTGDTADHALREWSKAVLDRARDLLHG